MSEQLKDELNKIGESSHDKLNTVLVDGEEAFLQDIPNITDHRTFGDIEEDEKEQWAVMYKSLDEIRRDDRVSAIMAIEDCVEYAMKSLGVDLFKLVKIEEFSFLPTLSKLKKIFSDDKLKKKLFREHRVRVSKHRKSQVDEIWQEGLHIYKDKELAYFIGEAKEMVSEMVLSVPFWLVRTNVVLPGGKGLLH